LIYKSRASLILKTYTYVALHTTVRRNVILTVHRNTYPKAALTGETETVSLGSQHFRAEHGILPLTSAYPKVPLQQGPLASNS